MPQPDEVCRFCGRTAPSRLLICMNTRDMEERAVAGIARCYAALERAGGGERGMERVDMLIHERVARASRGARRGRSEGEA
jgi:hypothetical protein